MYGQPGVVVCKDLLTEDQYNDSRNGKVGGPNEGGMAGSPGNSSIGSSGVNGSKYQGGDGGTFGGGGGGGELIVCGLGAPFVSQSIVIGSSASA